MSSHTLDPFKFEDFKLKYFTIHQESGRTIVFQPKKQPIKEYLALIKTFTGDIGLTLDEFKSNTFLLVTNLAPDMDINAIQKCQTLQLQLEATFEEALTQDVTIINMAICDGTVAIDKNFRVKL